MNDLMNALYYHALARSEAYLALAPEYPGHHRLAGDKERKLRAGLDPEQTQLLDDLMRELWLGHSAEQEALFQASLRLCRELGQLI